MDPKDFSDYISVEWIKSQLAQANADKLRMRDFIDLLYDTFEIAIAAQFDGPECPAVFELYHNRAAIQFLQEEITMLKKSDPAGKMKLAESEKKVSELTQELAESKKQVSELTQKLAESEKKLEMTVAEKKKDGEIHKKMLQGLSKKINILAKEKADLSESNSELLEENDALTNFNKAISTENEALIISNKKLEEVTRQTAAHQEFQAVRESVQVASKTIEHYRHEHGMLLSKIAVISQDLAHEQKKSKVQYSLIKAMKVDMKRMELEKAYQRTSSRMYSDTFGEIFQILTEFDRNDTERFNHETIRCSLESDIWIHTEMIPVHPSHELHKYIQRLIEIDRVLISFLNTQQDFIQELQKKTA